MRKVPRSNGFYRWESLQREILYGKMGEEDRLQSEKLVGASSDAGRAEHKTPSDNTDQISTTL